MKKTIMTLLVGTLLASAPLAAVAAAPGTPGVKPDTMQQHKDQTKTQPAAKDRAKKKARTHKARVGSKARKQSASSQLARDKNLD
jgi:hypothetical protein